MKKHSACIILGILLSWSCQPAADRQAGAKQQILDTEKAFEKAAAEMGIREAFLEFADDSAVINRGGHLYKGKKAIDSFYRNQPFRNPRLSWTPEFAEVSASADLGFTWGPFQFYAEDTSGKALQSEGFFHTVWKKQSNGSWRFVYD